MGFASFVGTTSSCARRHRGRQSAAVDGEFGRRHQPARLSLSAFQGDTHLRTQVEYHFPSSRCGDSTFAVCSSTTLRYLVSQAAVDRPVTDTYQPRNDGRQFLPPAYLHQGFVLQEDLHSSAARRAFLFADRSHATRRCGRGQRPGTKDVRMILVLGV